MEKEEEEDRSHPAAQLQNNRNPKVMDRETWGGEIYRGKKTCRELLLLRA